MLDTDRDELRKALTSALGMYDRDITDDALDTWMSALRYYPIERVRNAIKAHMESADDGKRAPRPVDIWRRLSSGSGKSTTCAAATLAAGRCQYPGVFSDATDGSGQWWCPWHREMRIGPQADRYIEASKSVPYEEAARQRVARMSVEANDNPYVKALRERMAAHGRKRIDRASDREPGQDDEDLTA